MSRKEIFYDSLEEESIESDSPAHSSDEDVSRIVPLYSGEISKSKIAFHPKKKPERAKPVINVNRTKRSYLTMYCDKRKHVEKVSTGAGGDTSRAVCDQLSPDRDSNLEDDLKEAKYVCHSDVCSDQEEFFEQMMTWEKKQKQAEQKKAKKVTLEPTCFTKIASSERNAKELLRRRQIYGAQVNMMNRIKIEEMKTLRKIKAWNPKKRS